MGVPGPRDRAGLERVLRRVRPARHGHRAGRRRTQHPVPDGVRPDALADADHDSGVLRPQHLDSGPWSCTEGPVDPGASGPVRTVGAVHGGCVQPDQDLAATGYRLGDVVEANDLRGRRTASGSLRALVHYDQAAGPDADLARTPARTTHCLALCLLLLSELVEPAVDAFHSRSGHWCRMAPRRTGERPGLGASVSVSPVTPTISAVRPAPRPTITTAPAAARPRWGLRWVAVDASGRVVFDGLPFGRGHDVLLGVSGTGCPFASRLNPVRGRSGPVPWQFRGSRGSRVARGTKLTPSGQVSVWRYCWHSAVVRPRVTRSRRCRPARRGRGSRSG